MKTLFTSLIAVIFFMMPFFVHAQFTDNFSDGDFLNNPQWIGNDTSWIVSSGQLQSFGPLVTGSEIYLSTASTLASDAQWEFFANPKVSTTNGNYMDIYLTSDSSRLIGSNSGYFVRIGNTTDEVSLYVKQAGVATKIIDGTDGIVSGSSTNPMKVKVTATSSNLWSLYIDFGGTGNNYVFDGSVTNADVTGSAFFGVLVKHSAANFNKYFFDDFYVGPIITDVTAPAISYINVITNKIIDVIFDEDVEITTAQNVLNYSADNGLGSPNSAVRDAVNHNTVRLTFTNAFPLNINNTLTVSNVYDKYGNGINPAITENFIYSTTIIAAKDLLINEIFADPTPVVGLPNIEWVEIYNNSSSTIDLNGLKFSSSSTSGTMTAYNLAAGQYLILCRNADTTALKPFGNVLGMGTFPSLTNNGTTLFIKEKDGSIIDSIRYRLSMYNDVVKSAGGWSLELINPAFSSPCSAEANWSASVDASGGTPGKINSIHSTAADTKGPQAGGLNVLNANQLNFCFNEYIDSLLLKNMANYTINNGIGNPDTVYVSGKCVTLEFNAGLPKDIENTITFSNIVDCSGNVASNAGTEFGYYTPKASFLATDVNLDAGFSDNSTITMGSIISWFWEFGDGDTAVTQNVIHTYQTTGTYDVCLTVLASNGLQDSSCIQLQIINVGLNDKAVMSNLQAYPNPTRGELFVNANGIQSVSIFNTLGEMILNEKSTTSASLLKFDLSGLNPGMYLLKAQTKEGGFKTSRIHVVR